MHYPGNKKEKEYKIQKARLYAKKVTNCLILESADALVSTNSARKISESRRYASPNNLNNAATTPRTVYEATKRKQTKPKRHTKESITTKRSIKGRQIQRSSAS